MFVFKHFRHAFKMQIKDQNKIATLIKFKWKEIAMCLRKKDTLANFIRSESNIFILFHITVFIEKNTFELDDLLFVSILSDITHSV